MVEICRIADVKSYSWFNVKARVTSKDTIFAWNNANSSGELFSMYLMDASGKIRVTAFNEECNKFYEMIKVGCVYTMSNCKGGYAKKQYSKLNNNYELALTRNTDILYCKDETGVPQITYDFLTVSEISKSKEEAAAGTSTENKTKYFECKAIVQTINSQNIYYQACSCCSKKVVNLNNGNYFCEKCNRISLFKPRLLINMQIGDWSSSCWVTCFSSTAIDLLNSTADNIAALMEEDPKNAELIFEPINYKPYIFELKSIEEVYENVPRNNISIVSARPLDYKQYNQYLINNLKKLTAINGS